MQHSHCVFFDEKKEEEKSVRLRDPEPPSGETLLPHFNDNAPSRTFFFLQNCPPLFIMNQFTWEAAAFNPVGPFLQEVTEISFIDSARLYYSKGGDDYGPGTSWWIHYLLPRATSAIFTSLPLGRISGVSTQQHLLLMLVCSRRVSLWITRHNPEAPEEA